jgi:hypothetical protein
LSSRLHITWLINWIFAIRFPLSIPGGVLCVHPLVSKADYPDNPAGNKNEWRFCGLVVFFTDHCDPDGPFSGHRQRFSVKYLQNSNLGCLVLWINEEVGRGCSEYFIPNEHHILLRCLSG